MRRRRSGEEASEWRQLGVPGHSSRRTWSSIWADHRLYRSRNHGRSIQKPLLYPLKEAWPATYLPRGGCWEKLRSGYWHRRHSHSCLLLAQRICDWFQKFCFCSIQSNWFVCVVKLSPKQQPQERKMQSVEQVVSSPECQITGWNDFCTLCSLLLLLFGNLYYSLLGLLTSPRMHLKHSHHHEYLLLFKILLLHPHENPSSYFPGQAVPWIFHRKNTCLWSLLLSTSPQVSLPLLDSSRSYNGHSISCSILCPVMLIIYVYDSSLFIYTGNPAEEETKSVLGTSLKCHIIQSWMRLVWENCLEIV